MKRLIHFLVRRYLPNDGKYMETKIKASSKFYAILLIKKKIQTMESKPVSTKQKELSVTILIDNVSVCISTKRYNQLIEWIDRYNSYQIGLEIYPPESNIHKQYAIKYKIALETLKKLKNELQKENPGNRTGNQHDQ